jgi:hypothetical protein
MIHARFTSGRRLKHLRIFPAGRSSKMWDNLTLEPLRLKKSGCSILGRDVSKFDILQTCTASVPVCWLTLHVCTVTKHVCSPALQVGTITVQVGNLMLQAGLLALQVGIVML